MTESQFVTATAGGPYAGLKFESCRPMNWELLKTLYQDKLFVIQFSLEGTEGNTHLALENCHLIVMILDWTKSFGHGNLIPGSFEVGTFMR